MSDDLDTKCINTVRVLAADMVQTANSGHPGAPMGCAPMAHVLFTRVLTAAPSVHRWPNRDRFVLSNGHGCALLYSLLHLTGYPGYDMDQLKRFRQLGSHTPGHPEANDGPQYGVEVTTGPLGQGLSNAVGLAMGTEHAAARFGRDLFDNFTFVICGDGCLMEGVTNEAASMAGHLRLGRLICLWDDNEISIDGGTELAFTEDVPKRFEALGWQVLHVDQGDTDLDGIEKAIREGQANLTQPTLIRVRTTIGLGSCKQGTNKVHGAPLGDDDLADVKRKFGFDATKSFVVDDDVRAVYADRAKEGDKKAAAWQVKLDALATTEPEKHAELTRRLSGKLPENWRSVLPTWKSTDGALATRKTSETVLNALAVQLPEIIGGSADLTGSTCNYLKCSDDLQGDNYGGRNIRFGVREHAMASVVNGLAAWEPRGFYLPFGATFLNFVGYAWGAMILSALSELRALYIMTHDSIGLGEDGPTHQPVEKAMLIRATPNFLYLRPGDGNETAGAYAVAIESRNRPVVLSLSRHNVPQLEGTSIEGVAKGGYALKTEESPDVVLVGTGTELCICVEAAKALKENADVTAQVVSMPCWKLFDEQPAEHRRSVFPKGVPVLSVEATVVEGWQKYAHGSIGLRSFGASAPQPDLYKHFGLTTDNVVDKAKQLIEHYSKGQAPDLQDRPF